MGKITRLFGRCVRNSIRALSRVRDSYVRSLTELSGSVQYAAATGYGSFTASYGFPMEITSSSITREISQPCAEAQGNRRAKGRAAPFSQGMVLETIDEDKPKGRAAPFSQGMVLETIDEDKPCEFSGDVRVGSGLLLGRRGSCHAWRKGTVRRHAGG